MIKYIFAILFFFHAVGYSFELKSILTKPELSNPANTVNLSNSLTDHELEELRAEFSVQGFIVPESAQTAVAKNLVKMLQELVSIQDPLVFAEIDGRTITKIFSDVQPIGTGSTYFLIKVEFNSAPASISKGEKYIEYYFNGTTLFQSRTYRRKISPAPQGLTVDRVLEIYDETDTVSEKQIRFSFATLSHRNEVRFLDQGLAFLETLPEQVTLSRSMADAEAQAWLGLRKTPRTDGQGRMSPGRLYFGLNYFVFDLKKTYQIQLSKSFLFELYKQGFLQINTYEADDGKNFGMPLSSFSNFGIPFEIVVLTGKGISLVKPYMQKMTLAN